MLQPYTSSFRELGVQGQYLDGESDLISHSLTRPVTAGKKLKIAGMVEGAVSIFMMNCFFWKQLATQFLLHHVAVFQHFRSFTAIGERGNRKVNVPVFLSVAPEIARVESIKRSLGLRGDFAFWAAEFLIAVNAKLVSVAATHFQFAAVLAGELVSFVSVLAAASVRAGHRAVEWIASEFLFVCGQVRLHHGERLFAFFASKANRRSTSGRRIFVEVLTAARDAAVFTPLLDFAWVAVKWLFATQAFHLDWHSVTPLLGGRGGYSCADRECQVAYAG
jgi:hypothetical protein